MRTLRSQKMASFGSVVSICLLVLLFSIITASGDFFDFEEGIGPGWNFDGIKCWYPDSEGNNSSNSFRSGEIDCAGTSSIYRNVTGTGTKPIEISFWWKKNGLAITRFTFSVDGRVERICCSYDWDEVRYTLPEDDEKHILRWDFEKKTCNLEGYGQIDDVSIESHSRRAARKHNLEGEWNNTNNTSDNESLYDIVDQESITVIIDSSLNTSNQDKHEWNDIINGINDAYTNGFYKVLIKKGTYNLSEPLILYRSICLHGESNEEVILEPIDESQNCFCGVQILANDVSINNVSFNGFAVAMDIDRAHNVTITNNRIISKSGIIGIFADEINILSNNINSTDGSELSAAVILMNTNGGQIISNNISGKHGIYMDRSESINISNNDLMDIECIADHNSRKCIKLNQCHSINIYHNNIKICSDDAVEDDTGENFWDCNYWGEINSQNGGPSPLGENTCELKNIKDLHTYKNENGWIS